MLATLLVISMLLTLITPTMAVWSPENYTWNANNSQDCTGCVAGKYDDWPHFRNVLMANSNITGAIFGMVGDVFRYIYVNDTLYRDKAIDYVLGSVYWNTMSGSQVVRLMADESAAGDELQEVVNATIDAVPQLMGAGNASDGMVMMMNQSLRMTRTDMTTVTETIMNGLTSVLPGYLNIAGAVMGRITSAWGTFNNTIW